MATVHPPRPAPPPQFALPRSCAEAGDDSDGESVAESCPFRPGLAAATDGHGLILGGACGDEEVEDDDDDDGCSSCVEGDGRYQLQLQEYGDGDDDGGEPETIVEGGVWWTHLAAAAAARDRELPQRPRDAEAVAEDPKSATARQEEDRKFWEDCLASGYP